VENRPGATPPSSPPRRFAHSAPDGYTTLFSSLSLLVNPILPGTKAKYDPFKGLRAREQRGRAADGGGDGAGLVVQFA